MVLVSTYFSPISFMPADNIKPWLKWGYYVSPMSYGQNAVVLNEFLDERWSKVRNVFFFYHCPLLHTFN